MMHIYEYECMPQLCRADFCIFAVEPELVSQLMNTTLPHGDSHTFVCAAVADPHPLFVFRFNGERITSNSSKYILVTGRTHGTLTVFNVQGGDGGTYSCSASNRYGSVSTAAVLTVEGGLGADNEILYNNIS